MKPTLSRSAFSSSVSAAGIRASSWRSLSAGPSLTLLFNSFCFPFFFFGLRPRPSSVAGVDTELLGGGTIHLSKSSPSGIGTLA